MISSRCSARAATGAAGSSRASPRSVEHGILFIADEVQAGFGEPAMFAVDSTGIGPTFS
jgi:hypothetical protein